MDDDKPQVDNKDQNDQTDKPTQDVDQLEKLQQRCEELENNWKRALADYKNLERRTAEEKLEFA